MTMLQRRKLAKKKKREKKKTTLEGYGDGVHAAMRSMAMQGVWV